MKNERRKVRGIFAALVADPYRKLVAIGLAIGLWFLINNQIVGRIPRVVSLTTIGSARGSEAPSMGSRLAVVLPTDRVVGLRFMDGDRPIDQVKVFLSGPRYRVDAIADETLDLQVAAFASLDWSTRPYVEFTAADIRRDLQGIDIELEPSRIRLEVERLDQWQLKLNFEHVELQDSQFGSRLRRDAAEFSADTVVILGTASALDEIRKPGPKPLRARITSSGSSRQVSAVIELATPKELGLSLAERPSVTIPILPETSVFDLELPLIVDDLALPPEQRGLYQPEVRSKFVRIRAGGDLRSTLITQGEGPDKSRQQSWASAHMRLLVHIPAIEPGATYGPEIVRRPELLLLGPLQAAVDRTEFLLDETVSVTLRKKQ